MKNRIRGVVLGVALAGVAGGALAQAPTTNPSAPDHEWRGDQHWGRHGGGWSHGGATELLRNLRELDLTEAQREQIHTIMQSARSQWQKPAAATPGANPMAALANPGDPGYAAAVEAAKQRAGARIQAMSDLQLQVYNVLTPQQKTAFAKLLADKQARWEKWRAAREQTQGG
jgi:Spy/CpxP family protein refolding chaperone